MKTLYSWLICAVLAIAIVVLPGCAGTPKRVAYKSIRVVADGVDVAMKAYAEGVVTGSIPLEKVPQIRRMHDEYRAVLWKALVAAEFNYEAASPATLTTLAFQLTSDIARYIK